MNIKSLLLAFLLVLSGCSADINDYQYNKPAFDLFGYFSGETRAWGMLQNYQNKQVRRFDVVIQGSVVGDTLTLNEKFVFDDGEHQTRIWRIIRNDDGSYQGTAGDIIGVAHGYTAGNAFNWRYDMEVKTDNGKIKLHFDDWLYRQDETHLFNQTSLRKFGVEVAKVTLFFEKKN
ncbi:DUF3833 domain-containing protein [Yersinia aldovae]|uniref:Protein of uncharacterized function (DUF3833) n=1 Tax=Yersinia aldovae TaxID=29483 RepID=A0A0T9TTA3_YERAL|nr:DUF3833 domain-containing protein [Yersinia aldovae]EEP95431.1 hypothetical protein yaldo0001_6280 [Yersinia aldovae ATCC 35236]CNL01130.1 Protein of uncharacterised function (DUF3833) [Yersinia aldovae]